DVARRLLPPDVLLARLEGHAVRDAPVGILRDADQPARHLALVLVLGGEEGGMRPAVAHRHPEALRRAEGDVRADLPRRPQQRERARVRTTASVWGWHSWAAKNTLRPAPAIARHMCIASAAAVASSSRDAPARGRPVRSATTVWKLIRASSRPWAISAWYGVYAV